MSRLFISKSENITHFIFLLVLIFAGLSLSCSSKQESQLLVGRWKYSGTTETVLVQFNENNTFSGLVFNLQEDWKFSGKWQLRKNVIKYFYHESDYTAAIGRSVDEDIIIEITPNSLLLKNISSGKLYSCIRY